MSNYNKSAKHGTKCFIVVSMLILLMAKFQAYLGEIIAFNWYDGVIHAPERFEAFQMGQLALSYTSKKFWAWTLRGGDGSS